MQSLKELTYATCIVATGVFGAFVFTSYYMAWTQNKETAAENAKLSKKVKEYEDKEEKNKELLYEKKYNISDALHNEKHADLKEAYLFESTPNGIVIIMYDIEQEKFAYWADDTIRFRYLQTVARRFVTENQCRDLYLCHEDKETKEDEKSDNENKTVSDNEEEDDDSSVFIKSKVEKAKEAANTTDIETNTYIHKGGLKDFYGLKKTFIEGKTLSFADFKNMQKN